jgi:hypothetical protein
MSVGTEAFKALIEFRADGASALAFLNVMGSRLGILHGKVKDLNSALGRMAIGGAAIVGGTMLLKAVLDTGKAAEGVNKVMTQMTAAGDSALDRQRAYNKAWAMTHDVVGKVSENLEAISMLTPQLGLQGAMDAALSYRKTAVEMSAITGKDGNQQALMLERTVHLSGRMSTYDAAGNLVKDANGQEVVNQAGFQHMNQVLVAISAAARGKIAGDDLLAFAKQARTQNLMGLSDQGWFDVAGSIQTMGGARAGTQVAAMMDVYMSGRMSKTAAKQLEADGLLNAKDVTYGKGPNSVLLGAGAVPDLDLLRSDPFKWGQTTMINRIRKSLADRHMDSSDESVEKELRKLKLARTAAGAQAEMVAAKATDMMEALAAAKANMSVDQYAAALQSSAVNTQAFHDAMENLALTFGDKVLPAVTSFTKTMTSAINRVALVFHNHPELPKQLIALASAIGIIGIAGGSAVVVKTVASGFGAMGTLAGSLFGGATTAAVVGGGEAAAVGVGGAVAADGALAASGIGFPVAAALAVGILGYLGVNWMLHRNNGIIGAADNTPDVGKPSAAAIANAGHHETKKQKAAREKDEAAAKKAANDKWWSDYWAKKQQDASNERYKQTHGMRGVWNSLGGYFSAGGVEHKTYDALAAYHNKPATDAARILDAAIDKSSYNKQKDMSQWIGGIWTSISNNIIGALNNQAASLLKQSANEDKMVKFLQSPPQPVTNVYIDGKQVTPTKVTSTLGSTTGTNNAIHAPAGFGATAKR